MNADRIAKITPMVRKVFEAATPSDVAKAIDQLFGKVFDVGDSAVDCRLEDL